MRAVLAILGVLAFGSALRAQAPAPAPPAQSQGDQAGGAGNVGPAKPDSQPAGEPCQASLGHEWQVAVTDNAPGDPIIDPVFKVSYAASVRGWAGQNNKLIPLFRVCCSPTNIERARTVAGLLARYYCYGRERLVYVNSNGDGPKTETAFHDPAFPTPGAALASAPHTTDFYLDDVDRGEGKEVDGYLFIFNASAPMHPVTVARDVAHEFSHLTLPGFRGFGQPEDWTNGYLGEVLYLQWLSEDTEETVASREDIAKWANGRCNRLIEKFLKIGPAKIRDEPALHFWGFEGMLLYLRQIYGLELLARVINYQTDNGVPTLARDLDLSISYAIKAMPWAPVVVPGTLTAGISSADPGAPDAAWTWAEAGESLVLPPGSACRCWVYLRGDNRYKIRAEVDTDGWRMRGANLAATTASLGLLSATAPETLFYANSEAWYEFQWRNIGDAPAVVQGWSWSPIDKH